MRRVYLRHALVLLATLLSLLSVPAAAETTRRQDAARLMNELMSGQVPVGGPFSLKDQDGKRRALADFQGRVVLLYFGYISCPDVCPTDLQLLAELMQRLGGDATQVQPVFVTLDPARDTTEIVKAYLAGFDERFVGLRGSATETRRVATLYKTWYEVVRPKNSRSYFIDHTAYIYMLDKQGRYVAFFPPGTSSARMEVMVREVLTAAH